MEVISKKNTQKCVRIYWYPLGGIDPLPDKCYTEISKKMADSPALAGWILKTPKNHHNAVLHCLTKFLYIYRTLIKYQ